MTTLILAGGFLGAGKTTLLLCAARKLAARGRRVGIVTNDQAGELVDTALVRQGGIPVAEVAGGCFCCRYPDLLKALDALQNAVAPDVILAEPVGSCTDLMATVIRPLRAEHEARYQIAPLTVLLDPTRRMEEFAAPVDYLYERQVAEAELVVVTKQDLPTGAAQRQAAQALALRYGPDRVFALSAATGEGVDAWLDVALSTTSRAAKALDVDYASYAAGEAALGWLNARGAVTARVPFSAQNWLSYLLRMLDQALASQGAAIAHIKAQIAAGEATYKASITGSGAAPTWDLAPADGKVASADFVLNARVQAPPQLLESAVRAVFAELLPPPDFHYRFSHLACFSPEAPQPTHRLPPDTKPTPSPVSDLQSPISSL